MESTSSALIQLKPTWHLRRDLDLNDEHTYLLIQQLDAGPMLTTLTDGFTAFTVVTDESRLLSCTRIKTDEFALDSTSKSVSSQEQYLDEIYTETDWTMKAGKVLSSGDVEYHTGTTRDDHIAGTLDAMEAVRSLRGLMSSTLDSFEGRVVPVGEGTGNDQWTSFCPRWVAKERIKVTDLHPGQSKFLHPRYQSPQTPSNQTELTGTEIERFEGADEQANE